MTATINDIYIKYMNGIDILECQYGYVKTNETFNQWLGCATGTSISK